MKIALRFADKVLFVFYLVITDRDALLVMTNFEKVCGPRCDSLYRCSCDFGN